MDSDKLEAVVEAFRPVRFGEDFASSGFVDECYDSGFSVSAVNSDTYRELSEFTAEILLNINDRLFDFLEDSPFSNQHNGASQQSFSDILVSLDDADIPLKEILPALAAFLFAGSKAASGSGVFTRGCLAASVYVSLCTAVKGNISATLHQKLGLSTLHILPCFSRGIDLLSLPDAWQTVLPTGRKRRPERVVAEEDENVEPEVTVDTNVSSHHAELILLRALTLYVRNLDLGLVPFHMGRLARTLACVWKRDYPEEPLAFDVAPRVSNLHTRKSAVDKCVSLLLSEAQKKRTVFDNLRVVFWSLLPGLLRLGSDFSSHKPSIPRQIEAHSMRILEFFQSLMRRYTNDDDYDEVTESLMQNFFTNVPDSQEYRRKNAESYVALMDVMNPALRNRVIQWVVMESEGERQRGRKLSLAIMVAVSYRSWEDVEIPYLKTASKQYAVWHVCSSRVRDRSAEVRKEAAASLSELLDKNPDYWMHFDGGNGGNVAGCSDFYAIPRKAFLQLLGKLLMLDFRLFDVNVKEVLLRAAQDPAKLIRQANLDVVSNLFKATPVPIEFPDLWIKAVFRLYMDSEQSIKSAVMAIFQKIILAPVTNRGFVDANASISWDILARITSDELGALRLLRQLLEDMAKADVLSKDVWWRFKEHLNGTYHTTAWKLLAELSRVLKTGDSEFAFEYIKDRTFEGDDDEAGSCAYQIIQSALATESTKSVIYERLRELKSGFPDIRGVATVVEAIRAINKAHEVVDEPAGFTAWLQDRLHEAASEMEETLNKYQTLIGENAEPGDVNPLLEKCERDLVFAVRVVGELGKFAGIGKNDMARGENARDNNALDQTIQICDFQKSQKFQPWVRAHGVFALGRLCLGAKPLIWAHCVNIVNLADYRLEDRGLRRDAIVVVFDLLKMFGDVVEAHLGKVYGWLTDPCIEIRGDVIHHIQNLLLNEHLQWNPSVFYQFLTSTCDPDEGIRDEVRTCLRSLIKKRNQCYTDFAEALVFLPGCTSHPRFKAAQVADAHHAAFPLSGRDNTSKRVEIYAFMLRQMTEDQKRMTFLRILEQILMPVVSMEVNLKHAEHSRYRNVLLDVMKVLALPEMEFMALTEDEEDAEGGEDEEAEAEPVDDAGQRHGKKLSKEEQKALFAKFRKEIVLRNLIPVLSCLYRQLEYLDDGELLTGCVALVASTAKANDVNLEELSAQTGGTDGQVLSLLANAVHRLENQKENPAEHPRSPPKSVTPGLDNVPFVRNSPMVISSDLPRSSTKTPSGLGLSPLSGSNKAAETPKNHRGKNTDGEPHSMDYGLPKDIAAESRNINNKGTANKRNRSKFSNAANVPSPKRRGEDSATSARCLDGPSKLIGKPGKTVVIPSTPQHSTRGAGSEGPTDDNLDPRAISTPISHKRKLNLTFGSDISVIEQTISNPPASSSNRTLRPRK